MEEEALDTRHCYIVSAKGGWDADLVAIVELINPVSK